MTARVLVVDDIEANVKLLEARLTVEYFETLTARNGEEALQVCASEGARYYYSRCHDAGDEWL